MEAFGPPESVPSPEVPATVAAERLGVDAYLALYKEVGEAVRWDQRLQLDPDALAKLLAAPACRIHVLRGADSAAIGMCEFDRSGHPQVELKNFGIVPALYGRGLGGFLLASALQAEWADRPDRIWLHTDDWDHAAAVRTYERAGFRTYDLRQEAAGPL